MRRDLRRVCLHCPIRTHLAECPSCGEATSDHVGARPQPRPSRFLYAFALSGFLLELAALPVAGVAAIAMGVPNTPVVLSLLLAALAVLFSTLPLWAVVAYLGSGFVEGLRGGGRAVAFGATRARRDGVGRYFHGVRRWARKAQDALAGAGYLYGSLLAVAGFVAVIVIDIVTEFAATDFRVDLFGVALVLLLSGLALPPMTLLALGLLQPDRLPGSTRGSGEEAARAARRGRTEVEGVASAIGPLLRDPAGGEVLAYRVRGTIGGHEVDDGDAIAFELTDEGGREGRVEADGPVLVALEGDGERLSRDALDGAFLRERGIFGKGQVTIHRLRPGDRVRVSADFGRALAGAGYRGSVSMVLRAGEQPIVLDEPG